MIALGNFDGVHFGHQAVIGQAVRVARARGAATIAATFDPHPVRHFKPGVDDFNLTTLSQRRRLLGAAGVDAMMVFHFNGALAGATPEEFVQVWLAQASAVVTGADFSFGRERAGDVGVLADLSAKCATACETVRPVSLDGDVVSSTRIREALRMGDCKTATRLLTRPFSVEGLLQPVGDRSSARPTRAVLQLGSYLRPCSGDYEARVRTADGLAMEAVARLDRRSTREIEVLDSDGFACPGDLHGQWVTVELLERIGEEAV